MKERLKINASGKISIYRIINGQKQLIKTRSNTILPLSKDIIARLLTNNIIGMVDTINVVHSGGTVYTSAITEYSHPSANEAQFVAQFGTSSSPSEDFDEIQLVSSNMGVFSQVTGLTETIGAGETIQISWTITLS